MRAGIIGDSGCDRPAVKRVRMAARSRRRVGVVCGVASASLMEATGNADGHKDTSQVPVEVPGRNMTTWGLSRGDAMTGAAAPLGDVDGEAIFVCAVQLCVNPPARRARSWRSRLDYGGASDVKIATTKNDSLIAGWRGGGIDTLGPGGAVL